MSPPQPVNPHILWTTEWYAWKEKHLNYRPYHVGTTPSGKPCPSRLVRVELVRPGMYRCPICGKEFPTATAELTANGFNTPVPA